MDTVALGDDPDRRQFNEWASLFDAPAYIRRARRVEAAREAIQVAATRQRDEWLTMPRLRLGTLQALAGDWQRFAAADVLMVLWTELTPRLRLPPARTESKRALRSALSELIESLERFNARWTSYLHKIDFREVNALREGYNRYYVLEKSCSLRSDLLAWHGFAPLPMMDVGEILRQMPTLPVPLRSAEENGLV